MLNTLLRAGLVTLLAIVTSPVNAKSPLEWLATGNYTEARSELGRLVAGQPDAAIHAAYLEALIRLREGRPDAAVSILRQILKVAPDFEPARRELVITLARLGQDRAALYQAERLAATTTDARLRSEMQHAIATGTSEKNAGISARLSILPSSNANRATSADTVYIAGLPFLVDPASRQKSGVGLAVGVTAWKRWQLSEDWTGTGSLSLDTRLYDSDVVADETHLGARLDFGRSFGRHVLSFGPILERTWKNTSAYRDRLGFAVSGAIRPSPKVTLGLDMAYFRQTYPDLEYLNGHSINLTPGLVYQIAPNWSLSLGVPLVQERTRNPFLDHDDIGLAMNITHQAGPLGLRFNLGYSENRFKANFPGTTTPRIDKVLNAGISVRHDKLRIGEFVPEFSYSYSRSRSNIAIQSYQSNDFGLGFVRRF